MQKKLALIVSLFLIASPVSADPPKAGGVRVETFDARTQVGRLAGLDDKAVTVIDAKGKKQNVALDQVARISLAKDPPDLMAKAGVTAVCTESGEVIPAASLKTQSDKLTMRHPVLGGLAIPITQVSCILMPTAAQAPRDVAARCRDLGIRRGGKDVILLAKSAENWVPVEGIVSAIGADGVQFRWKGEDRSVKLHLVPAIYLAAAGQPTRAGGATVLLTDGTRLRATSFGLAGGTLTVTSPSLGAVRVPLQAVASMSFASDRVTDLASLKPVAVKTHGFFDKAPAHRVNSSAGGGPLLLAGRTYPSGLGVHSFTELSYDLGGAYKSLVAVVGIDDSVRPAGDASVTFLGDGKVLGKPIGVRGKEGPQQIRVDVAGVKRLTLRVDFGSDKLDVADHVDIVAARLIK